MHFQQLKSYKYLRIFITNSQLIYSSIMGKKKIDTYDTIQTSKKRIQMLKKNWEKKKNTVGNYIIWKKIGSGGFSDVYQVYHHRNLSRPLAMKMNLSYVSHQQTAKQLKFLYTLRNQKHMPKLIDCLIYNGHVCFIQEYYKFIRFKKLLQPQYKLTHIRSYIYQLLKCLQKLKQKNIVHKDIKPSNFLYNSVKKKGVLIDFGLAEYISVENQIIPSDNLKTGRDGTLGYLPLEVFLWNKYSFETEIWAVGVIMLQLILKKFYIFKFIEKCYFGSHRKNRCLRYFITFILQLAYFGIQKLKTRLAKQGYHLTIPKNTNIVDNALNLSSKLGENAKNLLKRLLQLDPEQRITVEEALRHPFFKKIKSTR